jgi:hypothetical protein
LQSILFVLLNQHVNLSSVLVVLTLVAMICDVLNIVVLYVMNYIMVLIWKLPNISTQGTHTFMSSQCAIFIKITVSNQMKGKNDQSSI